MLASVLAGVIPDPEKLIDTFGLIGVWAVVFAETGLLVGFFLPGDALLFTAGFFASSPSSIPDSLHLPLLPLIIGIALAAIIGDQVGYVVGRNLGPALFRRPDSRFFKQANLEKAEAYFAKYGPKTVVLARYVPIVRTFTPVVAGASSMEYRTFTIYNIAGGLVWATVVPLLGYFLGQIDAVANNIEIAIVAVIAISLLPIVIEVLRVRRHRGDEGPVETDPAEAAEA